MNNDIQLRMLNAMYACLLPLVRMLLRAGINYRQFDDVARKAFVRESLTDTVVGKKTRNTSRIAVQTGLSRKEVKRIRDAFGCVGGSPARTDLSGLPSKVLHAWHTTPRFHDAAGLPRALEYQGSLDSFEALVRSVAADVPIGAVRSELLGAGAIAVNDSGRLEPLLRIYIPASLDEKIITHFSIGILPAAQCLAHNSDPSRRTAPFVQRVAFSDSLDPAFAERFRDWSRKEGSKLIDAADTWLSQHEIPLGDSGLGSSASSLPRVSLGVFYSEGPTAEELIAQESRADD